MEALHVVQPKYVTSHLSGSLRTSERMCVLAIYRSGTPGNGSSYGKPGRPSRRVGFMKGVAKQQSSGTPALPLDLIF